MRKGLLLVAMACLVVTYSIGQAQTPASGKVSSSWKCIAPNPVHVLPVGDEPNHMYILQSGKCTATKGEIAGVQEKEGTPTEFAETTPTGVKGHGTFVETLANGDKLVITYEFTGKGTPKVMESGSNKWTIQSATGKFMGIKGSGTCSGKGNPDGSANFECMGTYSLGK